MSDILKGELQDNQANTIYPHTEADVVFCADGETAQSKLTKYEDALGNVTGVTDSLEVDDSKVLVSSKALHKVNSSLQDSNTNESFNFGSLNGVRGFFTNPSKADDSFVPFSKSFISINQFKSSMISTHYYVGFKPRLVVCGVNAEAAFEWYDADTNKHYYNANTSKPYNLGQFSLQSVYAFDSIDDTGFTFRVGQSTYKNLNLIIFAIG